MTYRNVCENVVCNKETCWTAENPVAHGHAPVGEKRSKRKLIKKTTALLAREHARKLDKPKQKKRKADMRLRASF